MSSVSLPSSPLGRLRELKLAQKPPPQGSAKPPFAYLKNKKKQTKQPPSLVGPTHTPPGNHRMTTAGKILPNPFAWSPCI